MNLKLHPWLRFALVCAVGLAWLLLAGLVSAHPAGQAISAEVFWQQVDDTLAWLDGYPDEDSPAWQIEAQRWRRISAVTLPGGQVAAVDTAYLAALLEQEPPDREKLAVYLEALQQTRALTTLPGGEREMQLLSEILARPEFQEADAELNFIQRIMQWLADLYYRLLDLLFGDVPGSLAVPSEITIPVIAALLAAILLYVFRDTLRSLFAEAELAEESAGEGEILSARLAGQKAQALSSSGDYRHALRYLYLSALLLLDERGLLRYNRAQTNREYLRQVRDRPDLAEHLKEVVETFDRVWYGFQPIDEASYTRYARHVSALEEAKE